MIDELLQQDRDQFRAKINSETAKIPWRELQRFFAAGKLRLVAPGLDLVEVAYALQQDDTDAVQSWVENAELASVSDDQARQWHAQDAVLWAVVVKPWVLIQALAED